jgi:predicted dehydrogenase
VATATGGRIGWTSHPLAGVRRIIVTGSKGSKSFSDSHPHLEIFSDEPPFTLPQTHPWDPMAMWASTGRDLGTPPKKQWAPLAVNPHTTDVTKFIDCLEQGVEPELNARAAVHHIEVIMAGYRSAASGEAVNVG